MDQHIIESSSMKTLTGERHPEGLLAPLFDKDWETALTVILHSPHYTKRVDPMRGDPLNVAIRVGAPLEVVTALLEAYPDAMTIRNRFNHSPCHPACCFGISSEGMKMLLGCGANAAAVIDNDSRTPMHYLKTCPWEFFAEEQE
jgi:hypothetical protein